MGRLVYSLISSITSQLGLRSGSDYYRLTESLALKIQAVTSYLLIHLLRSFNYGCKGGVEVVDVSVSIVDDPEVAGWKPIELRIKLRGELETIMDMWRALSREACRVLGEDCKRVYIVVEPFEGSREG